MTAEAQMALLSNIAYLHMPKKLITQMQTRGGTATLGDLIDFHYNDKGNNAKYADTFAAIDNFSELRDLKIVGYKNNNGIGNGMVAYCFETNNKDAIFAFRGTENLTAANDLTLYSSQQRSAQKFVENVLQDKVFNNMYATGHSLGGNLAQYATINTEINNSMVFNSKGFTKSFVEKNQHKIGDKNITNYKSGNDWIIGINSITEGHHFISKPVQLSSKGHSLRNIISFYKTNGEYPRFGISRMQPPIGGYSGSNGAFGGGAFGGGAFGAISTTAAVVSTAIGAISARQIQVNTADLRRTASQITELARQYEGLYKEVLGKLSNMSATWQGIDSQTYRDKVESFRGEFVKMKAELDKYAEYLVRTAVDYDRIQIEAIERTKPLASGGFR